MPENADDRPEGRLHDHDPRQLQQAVGGGDGRLLGLVDQVVERGDLVEPVVDPLLVGAQEHPGGGRLPALDEHAGRQHEELEPRHAVGLDDAVQRLVDAVDRVAGRGHGAAEADDELAEERRAPPSYPSAITSWASPDVVTIEPEPSTDIIAQRVVPSLVVEPAC